MRILIVTSCTGEKKVRHERALTLADFQQGATYIANREQELASLLMPAEDLYAGQQHVRLMRGVQALKEHRLVEGSEPTIDLWILSAGYGLVQSSKKLAPYECTFQGMKKDALRKWADTLNIPTEIRQVLSQPYDLGLVLLGDAYLEACEFDATVQLGGPTILFCGSTTAASLPQISDLRAVILTNQEAKRFSCGLVGLKGEVVARLLKRLTTDSRIIEQLRDPATDILSLLENDTTQVISTPLPRIRQKPRTNPDVDSVISIPSSWWNKPHHQKFRYFIPEWDDLVDPDYDFETDTHSGGSSAWSNEVYAHQMYPEPNYDGILVSKVVAEKSRSKKERINSLGVHRYLRVPPEFPIMGDCGAFGYIMEEKPPYKTEEILDYYTRIGFNYGVSIDHLIVTATEAQKQVRYELTIHNAEEFLREHRSRGLPWEPIGAVQGWDTKSYAEAARKYVAMGYKYIGLGGLVRTNTRSVLQILDAVHQVVPNTLKIHLFGVARIAGLREFAKLGVSSVDSAAFLRQAWMGADKKNYFTEAGDAYAAIRIPEAGKSFRAKQMVVQKRATIEEVERLEANCLNAMHKFDKGILSVEHTLDILDEYDQLIADNRVDTRPLLRRTLEAQPWKHCQCEICRKDGIEVIIFRGNNRNRRRGFHNTYVFYQLFQRILAGENIRLGGDNKETEQLKLPFSTAEEVLS